MSAPVKADSLPPEPRLRGLVIGGMLTVASAFSASSSGR